MKRTHARTQAMLAGLIATFVAGAVSTAQAQTERYEITRSSITYNSLSSNALVIADGNTSTFDDTTFTVTLPFPVTFYGSQFSTLQIGANGAILFPGTGQGISFINQAPGSSATPNNFIAPLWDDLYIATGATLSAETVGTAPNRGIAFEWKNVSGCCSASATFDLTFKVIFYEGSDMRIDIEYGSLISNGSTFSATLGMEDESGGQVIEFIDPGCGASCGNTAVTGMSDMLVQIRPRQRPELTGAFQAAPRGALPGETVSATIALTNFGLDTAIGAKSEIWVSADSVLSPSTDVQVWAQFNDLPRGDTVVTATVTVPQVPPGDYFVFLVTDSTGRFARV